VGRPKKQPKAAERGRKMHRQKRGERKVQGYAWRRSVTKKETVRESKDNHQ